MGTTSTPPAGESTGRESGFHLHGASRPEGIRTVIPLSLAARIFSAAISLPNGLPAAPSRSCP